MDVKIIFLDFDGVVNSMPFLYEVQSHPRGSEGFPDDGAMISREMVGRVQEICDATGAVVVISSTWRILDSMADLRGWLRDKGLTADVVGKTPGGGGRRGSQIQQYLDGCKEMDEEVDSFVILDDDSDMDHLMDHLVQTQTWVGLQDEHVRRAIEMLGRKEA